MQPSNSNEGSVCRMWPGLDSVSKRNLNPLHSDFIAKMCMFFLLFSACALINGKRALINLPYEPRQQLVIQGLLRSDVISSTLTQSVVDVVCR